MSGNSHQRRVRRRRIERTWANLGDSWAKSFVVLGSPSEVPDLIRAIEGGKRELSIGFTSEVPPEGLITRSET